MADYGSEFNSQDASFQANTAIEDQVWNGWIVLGAFAGIGIGAFFVAVAAIPAGIVYGGVTYYGVPEGIAAIAAVVESGALLGDGSPLAQIALQNLVEAYLFGDALSVEGLLLLNGYDYGLNWEDYQNFIDFLDEYIDLFCYTDGEGNPLLCYF